MKLPYERPPKLTLFERFSLFWRFEYRHYPRNFVQGVRNLFQWFTIIWWDRDWDEHYLYEIMKFKITKMSQSHGKVMPHVRSERNVEIMKTVVTLMDKIQREDYLHEYFNFCDRKIEFKKVGDGDFYEVETTMLEDNLDDYYAKYYRTYKLAYDHPWYTQNPTRETLAMCMSQIQHDKAKRVLFSLMSNNIEKWWQ